MQRTINFVILTFLLIFLGAVSNMAYAIVEVKEDLYEDEIPPEFIIPSLVLFEKCTANILNRSIQLNSDGSFLLSNIPVPLGPMRARIVCEPASGVRNGQSSFLLR